MHQNDLGLRLRSFRLDRKLTQHELADKLNIARSTYVNYEKGRTIPSAETIARLSVIFETNLLDEVFQSSKDFFPDYKRLTARIEREELCALIEAYSSLSPQSRKKLLQLMQYLPKGGEKK